MNLQYDAAVLHAVGAPLAIERVSAAALGSSDVLVRLRAAGLCHTDLEVIEGSLRYPMPIVLGHEAAGVVEEVGDAVGKVRRGDHVVLSWNPHCGHCFYCDRALPILCEHYLATGPQALAFDGTSKAQLPDERQSQCRHLDASMAAARLLDPAQRSQGRARGTRSASRRKTSSSSCSTRPMMLENGFLRPSTFCPLRY